jgi:hypothetical protein
MATAPPGHATDGWLELVGRVGRTDVVVDANWKTKVFPAVGRLGEFI